MSARADAIIASPPAGERVAELHDRVEDRLHERALELGARKLLFLLGVREVTHLDQHRRHVGRLEHAQRRRGRPAARASGT